MNPADVRGLRDGDLDAREQHLYRLLDRARTVGDESATAALRELTSDYPNYHRSLYSRAMNQAEVFGDASLEAPLLAALADTRYNCQAWAAMACRALGFRSAVPGLVALLERDDWMSVEQAIAGLGTLGDATVVPVLAPLLDDRTPSVRQRAADALAELGGDAALDALWDAFLHRGFPRIGHLASALATFAPQVLPRLLAATDSDDPDTRYWAAVALGSTGDDSVVPTLRRLQTHDRGTTVFDGWVSVAAKKALRTHHRIRTAIAERAAAPPAGN